MPTVLDRFKKSWNAFLGRDPTVIRSEYGYGSSSRPDRMRFTYNNAQTIIASVYNRIAIDVSAIDIKHVQLDKNQTYDSDVDSYLNDCLRYEANIDQTGRAFIQDVVQSMFDEGCVAIVPTVADLNKTNTVVSEAKVYSLRTGKITAWFPTAVTVNCYNDRIGRKEDITLPKSLVAIIENPFYAVMNEPNSTLQRLLRTINQLNSYNDQNAAGKLDMIIQLPYVIKSDLKRQEAERRRAEIEEQLTGSKYGIAYADGTERIVQLNRSLENNLWQQVKDLTEELYNQLGMTAAIFDGTANEQAMINYNNRTIEPICAAIANELERKFLTPTARTQGHAIRYFRDPFKLVPVNQLADIADKFTRNEIMSSNEFRVKIGLPPSDDPKADELRNANLNQSTEELAQQNSELPIDGEETPDEAVAPDTNSTGSPSPLPDDASVEDVLNYIHSFNSEGEQPI